MSEKQKSLSTAQTLKCLCCNERSPIKDFYSSNSIQYKSIKKIPYCTSCINDMYQKHVADFKELGYRNPEQNAVRRLCMIFDLYYNEKLFDNAMTEFNKKNIKSKNNLIFITYYFRHAKLIQYNQKNYNSTILEEYKESKDKEKIMSIVPTSSKDEIQIVEKAKRFFKGNFTDDEYLYLQEQYDDWVDRNECKTKANEEIFKQLCFTQLEILRATNNNGDTKDLKLTFLKQLDAANLQPKQNKSDSISESQTFGTLINKWEDTMPVPEIDENLKDVDKIGLYIDVFMKGHLSKSLGLENGTSRLYEKYMEKYSVEKPEYKDDSDGEALFDAIFGKSLNEQK